MVESLYRLARQGELTMTFTGAVDAKYSNWRKEARGQKKDQKGHRYSVLRTVHRLIFSVLTAHYTSEFVHFPSLSSTRL